MKRHGGRAPLLAAAMIVRDEERHLEACLASIRDVVDEIIVVDTGSIDATTTIAESFGAQVTTVAWEHDFARARNVGLDLVRSEWVIYIDADERLRPVGRNAVRTLLSGADEVAYRVLLRPFVGSTPAREFRLWRNDPRVRFEGIIHEKVAPAIRRVAEAEGRPIGVCDLELDHVGYEGDQTAKHLRNLPLLEAQLAIEPDNVYNLRHLGEVQLAFGREREARSTWERARAVVLAAPEPVSSGALVYADLLRLVPPAERSELLREALLRYPHDPVLRLAEANAALDDGRPDGALGVLDDVLAHGVDAWHDTVSHDERLTAIVQAMRGAALIRLGRFADAAEAFAAAEIADPTCSEHGIRRQYATLRDRLG